MAFFIINISNSKDVYCYTEVEWFNNETEKFNYIRKHKEKNEVWNASKAKSLSEILIELSIGNWQFGKSWEEWYDSLIEKLGEDINSEFPDEKFTEAYISQLDIQGEKCFADILSDSEDVETGGGIDWMNIDDETEKWDRETGGSWRDGNDFG